MTATPGRTGGRALTTRREGEKAIMSTLHVAAFFRARPGRGPELGEGLLALVAPTRQEPGSLRYDILQSREEPDLWFVREEWSGQDAFDTHMATPYVQALMARVPKLCAAPPQLGFYLARSPS